MQGYEGPEKVVEVWLKCVIAAQYMSDRLLMDVRAVEVHMHFWQKRLMAGTKDYTCLTPLELPSRPISLARASMIVPVHPLKVAVSVSGQHGHSRSVDVGIQRNTDL